MKLERTKNAAQSMLFGTISRIYQILVPFILRTLMINFLGVGYLGLNSLFSSILQMLNLAELGIGAAMVYSMYKPIAEDDTETLCALLNLYKLYYRIIGSVIAVVGIVLLPVIPLLIRGEVPEDINIFILYLLNLSVTVFSYWLFAYKNSLLTAHQRNDISSKVKLLTDTIQYIGQVIALCVVRNYYVFLIFALVSQILNNIFVSVVVDKKYPSIRPKGKLDKEKIKSINQKIKDLFYNKIGIVIVNSADTIVISAFLGLTILAIYQNYFYILNSIKHFIAIILTACVAGIGNSLITETKEKNYTDFKTFTFLFNWITSFCTCCLLCLYQPFMKIWMGSEYMLEFSAVVCFCLYFYIYVMNALFTTYKDAAGIWHQDRFRPIINAGVNLIMNLIMVQFWGIYGVLLSTVISTLIISVPWVIHNLFTYLFDRAELRKYIIRFLIYILMDFIVCVFTYFVCSFLQFGNWLDLLVKGVICCLLPNMLFWLMFKKTNEFKMSKGLFKRILKRKKT